MTAQAKALATMIDTFHESRCLYLQLASKMAGTWTITDGVERVLFKTDNNYLLAQVNPHSMAAMLMETDPVAPITTRLELVALASDRHLPTGAFPGAVAIDWGQYWTDRAKGVETLIQQLQQAQTN
jgi:hypothetical protein